MGCAAFSQLRKAGFDLFELPPYRAHKLLSESFGWIYKRLRKNFPLERKYRQAFFKKYPSLNAAAEKKEELQAEVDGQTYKLIIESRKWQAETYIKELEYLIEQELAIIEALEERIKQIERRIRKSAEQIEETKMLMKIPGAGAVSASIIFSICKRYK